MNPGSDFEWTIKEYEPGDAQGVADIWNASDSLWPDGFTGGIPITAERVQLWHEYDRPLATYLAIVESRPMGYCSLHRFWTGENAAYVGLLGLHPDVLSRGLGKALLLKCVERTCQEGWERLDLHTWSGNERAVPPYKKTGFFWVPETWVYMQNYIPLILKEFPDYFTEADWYECLQREVTMAADDLIEDGVGLYPYRWCRADGKQLTVWIDRAARGICGFETDKMLVRCAVEGGRVIGGVPARVRWTLVNKGDDPLPVTLLARGSEKAKLEKDTTLSLVGRAQLEAQLVTEPDFSSVWKGHRTAVVTTTLFLGDRTFTLKAGVVGQPAVLVEGEPSSLSCVPGRPQPAYLRLRNHLPRSTRVQIGIATGPGITGDPSTAHVELPAEGLAGLPLTLTAQEPGVHALRVQPTLTHRDKPLILKPTVLRIIATSIGGTSGYLQGEQALMENNSLRVTVSGREGGKLRIIHKGSGRQMVEQSLNVGPPFWPSDMDWKTFPLRLEEEAGRMATTVSLSTDAFPGLTIDRSVTLSAGPLIVLRHTLINSSADPIELQLLLGHNSGWWQAGEVALPLREGLVVERWPGFPDWRDLSGLHNDAFAERWMSLSRFDQTLGFLWDEAERVEFGEWEQPPFFLQALTVHARAHITAPDFFLFAGPGGWQAVRETWRSLLAPGAASRHPRPQPSFQVQTTPQPFLLMDGQGTGTLDISSYHDRRLKVNLKVETPEGLAAEIDESHFPAVFRDHPAGTALRVRCLDSEPEIAQAEVCVSTPAWQGNFPVPVLSFGSTQKVKLTEGMRDGKRVLEADNGRMRFAVAPGFRGKMIALMYGETNHLWSTFPKPESWSWLGPWYGGLGPFISGGERPLWFFDSDGQIKEPFDAQLLPVNSVTIGSSALAWSGVRLRTRLQHRDLRGLELELDYLTVGRSNVLAVISRLINPTTAPFQVSYRLDAALRLGGSVEDVLLYRSSGPASKRLVNQVWKYPSGDWAAVESPSAGLWAVMVNATQGCQVEALEMAHFGAHLGNAVHQVLLHPESTTETLTYVVLTQDSRQARLYAALRDLAL